MPRTNPYNVMNYPKPTDAEVAQVMEHWDLLRRITAGEGAPYQTIPPIDSALLQKVAVHQQWQKAMACTHSEGVTMRYGESILCEGCDRPMQFLSDVQVQAIKDGVSI